MDTNDVHYIITNNIALQDNDTLFIKPGTILKIKDGCSINGTIIAIGKPDSMITFTKTNLGGDWGTIRSYGGFFDYCIAEYGQGIIAPYSSLNSYRNNYSAMHINNSIYRYINHISFQNQTITSSTITASGFAVANNYTAFNYCNIIGNRPATNNLNGFLGMLFHNYPNDPKPVKCNIYSNTQDRYNAYNIIYDNSQFHILTLDSNYYGSSNENTIRKYH